MRLPMLPSPRSNSQAGNCSLKEEGRRRGSSIRGSAKPAGACRGAADAEHAADGRLWLSSPAALYPGFFPHHPIRDRHFADTLVRVRAHLAATRGPGADTVVVWAHNSHLGDAGATQRSFVGETNLGQLAREKARYCLSPQRPPPMNHFILLAPPPSFAALLPFALLIAAWFGRTKPGSRPQPGSRSVLAVV